LNQPFPPNTAQNSDEDTDKRIDSMLMSHAIPEPSRSFIDKVYRPYCKEWARYADSEDGDIDAAMEAIVSLCGNIILEAIKSTCEEHEYIGAGQNLMRALVEMIHLGLTTKARPLQ